MTASKNATSTTTTSASLPKLRYSIGDVVCPGDRLGMTHPVQAGRGTRVPGTTNTTATSCSSGSNWGAYGVLQATLVGSLQVVAVNDDDKADNSTDHNTAGSTGGALTSRRPAFECRVQELSSSISSPPHSTTTSHLLASSYVPQVGQLVLGRVLRITPQNAVVQLLVLEGGGAIAQLGLLEGTIKREDVTGRVTPSAQQQQQQPQSGGLSDKNAVTGIGGAFQPSDVVACRIVSVSSGDQRCYDLSTAEAELGVLQATCHHCKTGRLVPKTWREMICSDCGHAEPRKVAKPGSVVGAGQQLPAVE